MLRTKDIELIFRDKLERDELNEEGMLELIGTSFIADSDSIFGVPNKKYIDAEIKWYESQSRSIMDINYDPIPKIWQIISSENDLINSNYGWCIYSEENGNQYNNVVEELRNNPNTRRASMIYTRPSMHTDYFIDHKGGQWMSDFICTHAVDYFIRNGYLSCVVKMRSNDVVFGYKNDYAWQKYVLNNLSKALGVPVGTMIWQASSLHIYPNQFKLLEE